MFGLKKLQMEVHKLKCENLKIRESLGSFKEDVKALRENLNTLDKNQIEWQKDVEGQNNESIRSFCDLGTSLSKLEQKVQKIESRSKPGRKPKAKKNEKANR